MELNLITSADLRSALRSGGHVAPRLFKLHAESVSSWAGLFLFFLFFLLLLSFLFSILLFAVLSLVDFYFADAREHAFELTFFFAASLLLTFLFLLFFFTLFAVLPYRYVW